MTKSWCVLMGMAALAVWVPSPVCAQEFASPPQPVNSSPPLTGSAALAPPAYTQQQIDQMIAPIALYPDSLIAPITMAATYPLEVVEAHRWLQNPQNAALKGDQLATALAALPWDPSVKSLVAFPQIITMMDNNLQWTEQLGDAFLAQQAAVMDSVQRLRQMAQSSGNLNSTPQQSVSTQDGAYVIQPANPETVYIPTYNPAIVYGAWPWPDYPPYYFPPPPGFVYANEGFIGFGFGIGVVDWLWGWNHWDWRDHRIGIDDRRFAEINHNHSGPSSGVWQHDPFHRHGVPYHSDVARQQFQAASNAARRNFRGFAEGTPSGAGQSVGRSFGAASQQFRSQSARPNFQSRASQISAPQSAIRSRTMVSAPQRSGAPIFESFSRGSEVHAQAARGSFSRSSMPHVQPGGAGRAATGGGGHAGSGYGNGRGR